MKESLYKKILLYGIVFLFIGAAIVPSISGYNNKISIQSTTEDPTSFPLNADNVNAYWKFDEGSGNTAHDSSGHGYDGTIYGATWTTDTPSGTGYALNFDGVNDYVNFDDYAENYLGFNRTDDLKYSFHFKTSSTDKGIIYSTCHGDAYGYNPGFHIALLSDGRFEVKMWRLNCGILMTSTNSYNNGAWHLAEIFYYGDSALPKAEIYVDGTFDSSYEKYVCPFYSDQFHYAQIGRNSADNTDYFEGKIDEFKIIKYPGGNDQNPPTIDGPTTGQPGAEYDYTFVSNDPDGDDVSYYIDWDDGTSDGWTEYYQSGEVITLSHTWNEEGRYIIKAKCKDSWDDSGWSEYEVRIGNQAPDPPTITGQKYGDPGQEITYTFASFDYEGQDVKYIINWDDGDTEETGYYPHNTPIEKSHSWDTEDDYFIKARAIDTTDREGEESEYHIRIGDRPPNKPSIYGAVQGKPNIEYVYGFVSTDPENDNISYDIDWGDGNVETNIGPFPSGEIFSRSHSWDNTGTYTIEVRAKDEFDYPSAWSEYEIIVYEKSKASNFNLLNLLFERFPRAFLVFRYFIPMGGEYI